MDDIDEARGRVTDGQSAKPPHRLTGKPRFNLPVGWIGQHLHPSRIEPQHEAPGLLPVTASLQQGSRPDNRRRRVRASLPLLGSIGNWIGSDLAAPLEEEVTLALRHAAGDGFLRHRGGVRARAVADWFASGAK